jgi:protein-S-isoprenylcysteine O-methyltransferase Ste14
MGFLRTLGWLMAIVLSTIPCYWFVVHPRAEYWRSKRGARFRILAPAWIAMWVVAAALTDPWRHVLLYDTYWTWLPAALFFAAGFYLYHRARAEFTLEQLTGRPEVEGGKYEQRLITTGVHAHVRHPVYLGHLCELIAWSVGTGLLVIYFLTGFAIATGAVMIRMEDEELERRFGEPYREYRKAVPGVLPRLRLPRSLLSNDPKLKAKS